VFVACTVPVGVPHTGGLWTDKSDHLLAFVVLEILLVRALVTLQKSMLHRHLLAVALSAMYGAVLEAWQGLLPWRSMELLDWVADVAGAILGAVLYGLIQRSCKPGSTA
jgi:VanZ family protein